MQLPFNPRRPPRALRVPSACPARAQRVRNGDRVFLALMSQASTGGKKVYTFQYFLASHVTLGKMEFGQVEKVWRIGRVVDGNQSKNMVTLCVDVEPVTVEGVTSAWSRE